MANLPSPITGKKMSSSYPWVFVLAKQSRTGRVGFGICTANTEPMWCTRTGRVLQPVTLSASLRHTHLPISRHRSGQKPAHFFTVDQFWAAGISQRARSGTAPLESFANWPEHSGRGLRLYRGKYILQSGFEDYRWNISHQQPWTYCNPHL